MDPADLSEEVPQSLIAARNELDAVVGALDVDEIRVLTRIAYRLEVGADVYGTLELAFDRRDFRSQEAREELEDALVYLACAWLKAEEGGHS